MNLVLILVSSFWFWADIILSLSGGVIVAWGLAIEKNAEKLMPPADFKPDIFGEIVEAYKREIDRGWRILMAGIIVEVVAALGISIISGLEIADLTEKSAASNLEAKQAGKDAADAKLLAANIGTTNAQLSLQVEGLRSNNLVLEAAVLKLKEKMRDRSVSQRAKRLLQLAENKGFLSIMVNSFQSDREAVAFGMDITDSLKHAGFNAEFSSTITMNTTNTGAGFIVFDMYNPPAEANFVLWALRDDCGKVGWYFNNGFKSNVLQICVFPKPKADE